MRQPEGPLLPPWLYCWLFEHDDQFKHSLNGISQHRYCQRCWVEL